MQETYLHGGVGFVDAERILLSRGFQPILFPYQHSFSIKAKLARIFFLLKTFFAIERNSVVFFLHPAYARMNRILLKWLSIKKVQIVCYIADIEGIRDGDAGLLEKEIKFFREFNFFIVHNKGMGEWLHKNVSSNSTAVIIQFFDFLAQPFAGRRSPSYDIAFGGNLEKSFFLKKLCQLEEHQPQLQFHLYGDSQTNFSDIGNVEWYGVKSPSLLPSEMHGSFGLVWDGDSLDRPGGSLGDYMKYNSPHKLSLYILSKLPIIIAHSAATASLIRELKIGFTVDNLYELEEKIRDISEEEYLEMQMNMELLAQRLSKGDFLNSAIDEILGLNN